MALQLDNLVEYWGDKQLAPMLFVNAQQRIVWHNRWAKWLFQSSLGNKDLRQLPAGKELAALLPGQKIQRLLADQDCHRRPGFGC